MFFIRVPKTSHAIILLTQPPVNIKLFKRKRRGYKTKKQDKKSKGKKDGEGEGRGGERKRERVVRRGKEIPFVLFIISSISGELGNDANISFMSSGTQVAARERKRGGERGKEGGRSEKR